MADKNPKKKSSLVPVSNVLQALLAHGKSPLKDSFIRWKIWRYWAEIVGPAVAAGSAPIEIKRGCLIVWAKSSAQMQDLHFVADAIRLKVNKFLGDSSVRSIRFTLDESRLPQNVVQDFDLKSPYTEIPDIERD
jgi:hypothetical protein